MAFGPRCPRREAAKTAPMNAVPVGVRSWRGSAGQSSARPHQHECMFAGHVQQPRCSGVLRRRSAATPGTSDPLAPTHRRPLLLVNSRASSFTRHWKGMLAAYLRRHAADSPRLPPQRPLRASESGFERLAAAAFGDADAPLQCPRMRDHAAGRICTTSDATSRPQRPPKHRCAGRRSIGLVPRAAHGRTWHPTGRLDRWPDSDCCGGHIPCCAHAEPPCWLLPWR